MKPQARCENPRLAHAFVRFVIRVHSRWFGPTTPDSYTFGHQEGTKPLVHFFVKNPRIRLHNTIFEDALWDKIAD